MIQAKGAILACGSKGFALARAAADEAELLMIAVAPEVRRQGVARRLLGEVLRSARDQGAKRVFLEVAAGNTAARSLYLTAGFKESGRRRAYYRRSDGSSEDAILMEFPLSRAR